MDPADPNNSLQDIQTTGTGIIWKECDDEWITKLLETGFTKIPISEGEKLKFQGVRVNLNDGGVQES